MSLIDQLITDIQQLYHDTKKNTPLRQLIQLSLNELKVYKLSYVNSSPNKQGPKDLFPLQAVFKALSGSSQTKYDPKNPSIIGLCAAIISKTINLVTTNEYVIELLNCLCFIRDTPDEQIQLKIVQCSHQMIHRIDLSHSDNYEKLMSVMMVLASSRNPIVQSTSITGLYQLIQLIFEQHAAELSCGNKVGKNGNALIMDLIGGIQGQKVQWIQGSNSKGICRDLLIHIINQLGPLLLKDDQFTRIITEYISPIVYEEMALDDYDIQFNARRIRTAFCLINNLHLDVALIKHISLLFTRSPSFHYIRFWILEGILYTLSDQQLILILSQSQENQTQSQQLTYLQHVIHLIKLSSEQECTLQQLKSVPHSKQAKFMESTSTDFSEPTTYTPAQFAKLSVECMLQFSELLLSIANDLGIVVGQAASLESMPHNATLLTIIDGLWMMVLKFLKLMLKNEWNERQLQNMLNIIQIWVSVSGTLGCLKVRDTFLKLLQSCVTDNTNEILTEKNIQSSKILFNVAHCLGSIMDEKAWFVVLQTLQIFEIQLSRIQQTQQTQSISDSMCAQEPSILQSVLDDIFSQSSTYDDSQLLQVLGALNQLSLTVMEQTTTNNNLSSKDTDSKALNFCLKKIQMMINVNWFRVNIFWTSIDVQFSCIVHCKQPQFRSLAIETISNIIQEVQLHYYNIIKGFQYFQKAYNSSQNQQTEQLIKDPNWSRECWQSSLLQPIHEIVKAKFPETRLATLQFILRLLQNNGHEFMQVGFMSAIEVLKKCADEIQIEETETYIPTAFQILELIIQQYLHVLDPNTTRDLLPLISEFRSKTVEPNISFVSVGLIWQLADNLGKLQAAQQSDIPSIEQLWSLVIHTLKDLCLDNAPEVRQQAIHIIIQITLINCAAFRIDYQISLLRQVHLSIFDALIGRVAQLQSQWSIFHIQSHKFLTQAPKFTKFTEEDLQEQDSSKWEETLKVMVQNLSKVIKKLQQIPGYEDYSQGLHDEVFLRLFIMFRFNSIDLRQEITRFIRENTELIVSNVQVQSLEWSRELIQATKEFMFQKVTDQRDQKILINKILPDICETFALLMKAHNRNFQTYPEFIDDILECYQQMIEHPSRVSPINTKLWFDEKYLHDYVTDFLAYSSNDEVQGKILRLVVHNLKWPQGQHTITDGMIKKYVQLYEQVVVQENYILLNQSSTYPNYSVHMKILEDYIEAVEAIMKSRSESRLLQAIKTYNNSSLPLWNYATPILQSVLRIYKSLLGDLTAQVVQNILTPTINIESTSLEAQKSCCDLELSWCEWASEQNLTKLILQYWKYLNQKQVLPDDLLYSSRKRVIQILFSRVGLDDEISTIQIVVQELLSSFSRDEQINGSMPLTRMRVRETVFVLQELIKLNNIEGRPLLLFFGSLIDLITTKEQEIKIPLQMLFREIAALLILNQ